MYFCAVSYIYKLFILLLFYQSCFEYQTYQHIGRNKLEVIQAHTFIYIYNLLHLLRKVVLWVQSLNATCWMSEVSQVFI
jgi:hypothetical protein